MKKTEGLSVKQIRKALGLSQEMMAQMLGLSFVTINRWENRHFHPTMKTQRELCRIAALINQGVEPQQIIDTITPK